jgi:hypothetical protein
VDLNGDPVRDVRIRVIGHGEPSILDSGEFSLQLAGAPTVIEVQTISGQLQVVYPPAGRVALPRDPAVVVPIVVGRSDREVLSDLVAARMIQIEHALNRNGVAYSASADSISEGLRRIASLLELRETEIEEGLARRRAQNDAVPALLGTIDRYILELRDLHDAFTLVAPYAAANSDALQALRQAMQDYNAAFEELNGGRAAFRSAINAHWSTTEAAGLLRDLDNVYTHAIDDIHRGYILPLNESLLVLQLAHTRDRPSAQRIRQAAADAAATARSLDPRVPVLEERARQLRTALQR